MDPVDLVDLVDLVDPVDPVDLADHVDLAVPVGLVDPVDLAVTPAHVHALVDHADRAGPADALVQVLAVPVVHAHVHVLVHALAPAPARVHLSRRSVIVEPARFVVFQRPQPLCSQSIKNRRRMT